MCGRPFACIRLAAYSSVNSLNPSFEIPKSSSITVELALNTCLGQEPILGEKMKDVKVFIYIQGDLLLHLQYDRFLPFLLSLCNNEEGSVLDDFLYKSKRPMLVLCLSFSLCE